MRHLVTLVIVSWMFSAKAQWRLDLSGDTFPDLHQIYNLMRPLPSVNYELSVEQRERVLAIFQSNNFLCKDCPDYVCVEYLFYKNRLVGVWGKGVKMPAEAKRYLASVLKSHKPDSSGSKIGRWALVPSGKEYNLRNQEYYSDSVILRLIIPRRPWELCPERYQLVKAVHYFSFDDYSRIEEGIVRKLLKKGKLSEENPGVTIDFSVKMAASGKLEFIQNLSGISDYNFVMKELGKCTLDSVLVYAGDSIINVRRDVVFSNQTRYLVSISFYLPRRLNSPLLVGEYGKEIGLKINVRLIAYYTYIDEAYEEHQLMLNGQYNITVHCDEEYEIRLNDSITLLVVLMEAGYDDGRKTYTYGIITPLRNGENFIPANMYFYQGGNPFACAMGSGSVNYLISGTIELDCKGLYYILDGKMIKVD